MVSHTSERPRIPARTVVETPGRALMPRFAVPPPPDSVVERQRLLDALDRGVSRPLTVVSAPAGTGKTVAVASWAASGHAPGPVVWISLNAVDGGLDVLWSLIVDGLRRGGVVVNGWLKPAGGHAGRAVLVDLGRQIAADNSPVTVILDCDIEISKDAASELHELLAAAGGHLRLVLISRADPLLPLHLYRLEGALTEIRMADLAFTTEEAQDLLSRRGVELTPDVLDVVMARTRGWVAGLLLTSMSLVQWKDHERAARELTGASGSVAEYLLSEVLDAQTPSVRRLLLRTSVVDVVRPGLAEELAGAHAGRAMAFLTRGNAFLDEVPETVGWYRYHPLFRELLYAQLAYEQPDEVLRLHLVAARWLAAQGLVDEAVRNAIAARAWEKAARIVIDDLAVPGLISTSSLGTLSELFEQLPDDATGPCLSLVRAATALARSDHASAGAHLDAARSTLSTAPAAVSSAALLTLSFLTTAHAARLGDHDTVMAAAAEAERLLGEQDPHRLAAHPGIEAVLHATKAAMLVGEGSLSEATAAYVDAAEAARRAGLDRERAEYLGQLSLAAAWQGQSRKAVRLARQAIALQTAADLPLALRVTAPEIALAWVHAEMYNLEAARRHVTAAEGGAASDDAMSRVMLALVQSRLQRAHGDVDGARAPLQAARAEVRDLPAWLNDRLAVEDAFLDIVGGHSERAATLNIDVSDPVRLEAHLVRAHARIISGRYPDQPVAPVGGGTDALTGRVDKWLLESLRQLRRGDEQRAAEALHRSLRLAAPERLRRPFREAPPDVRRLLRTRPDLTLQHQWLVAAAADPHGGAAHPGEAATDPAAAVLVESLTEKETEVLGYLAQLLTTEEIAGALFVSVNTIRTHVRNILRKLSVSRRNEAIRRARDLGILTS